MAGLSTDRKRLQRHTCRSKTYERNSPNDRLITNALLLRGVIIYPDVAAQSLTVGWLDSTVVVNSYRYSMFGSEFHSLGCLGVLVWLVRIRGLSGMQGFMGGM